MVKVQLHQLCSILCWL